MSVTLIFHLVLCLGTLGTLQPCSLKPLDAARSNWFVAQLTVLKKQCIVMSDIVWQRDTQIYFSVDDERVSMDQSSFADGAEFELFDGTCNNIVWVGPVAGEFRQLTANHAVSNQEQCQTWPVRGVNAPSLRSPPSLGTRALDGSVVGGSGLDNYG